MASRILGIDLGAYSVKVVAVSPGFRSATVVDAIERRVPPGDEPPHVRAAQVLGQIIRERKLDHDTAFAALAGDRVFIHVLDFGFKNLRRADLEAAVGAELESILPIDLEDMVYAFDTLPRDLGDKVADLALRSPGDDDPTFVQTGAPVPAGQVHGVVAEPTQGTRVLACAAMQSRAGEYLELLSEQGASPRGLIAGPASYARLAERIAFVDSTKGAGAVALIDIGHVRTDVCVVAEGRAIFARTVTRAGHDLTSAIAKVWSLPYEQAENAKHQDGFIASSAEPATSESWARIHEALVGEMQPLARDLRQTLNACRAKTGVTVQRVILMGGSSRLRGINSYLNEELGVVVSTLGPDDNARILGAQASMGAHADVMALAAGVAFEGATGRAAFDLRQGQLAYKADLSFLRAKATQLVAAALVIIAFGAGSAYAALYKVRKAEKVLDERVQLESAAMFADGPLSAEDVLLRIQPSEDNSNGGPSAGVIPTMTAYDVLLAFNAALPERNEVLIDVRDLDIKQGKITIKATATPNEKKTALDAIDALEEELKKSECFKEFTSGESQPGPNDTREFSMTIKSSC